MFLVSVETQEAKIDEKRIFQESNSKKKQWLQRYYLSFFLVVNKVHFLSTLNWNKLIIHTVLWKPTLQFYQKYTILSTFLKCFLVLNPGFFVLMIYWCTLMQAKYIFLLRLLTPEIIDHPSSLSQNFIYFLSRMKEMSLTDFEERKKKTNCFNSWVSQAKKGNFIKKSWKFSSQSIISLVWHKGLWRRKSGHSLA